jgi:D-xylose transport system substrate-binding protein
MSRGRAWSVSIISVVALVVVGWALAGCGGDGADKTSEGTIAFLLPNEQAPRYRDHDRPEFERKVAELCDGCRVIYSNAKGDASLQQKQAEKALAQGADVLVVDPVDVMAAAGIVYKAKPRGVPVVSYDRLIFNARVDYYVDAKSEEIGEVQAAALAAKLKEAGKPRGPIAIITLGPGGPVNSGAGVGFEANKLEVGAEYDMPPSRSEASVGLSEREMRRAIAALGRNGFAGVYAFDDKAASGVVKAMKSAGVNPADRFTTGSGATIPALQRILAGQQYMTVYEGNKEEAEVAAEIAVEFIGSKEIPPSKATDEPANGLRDVPAILLKPVAVTKNNMKSTVIDDGFVDPARLCTSSYAKYCQEVGITPG